MKKLLLPVICLITALLTSCQFSENIYINEDGSGSMTFSVDASELMAMAGDKLSEGEEETVIDSTIVFKDFLEEKKDSIATLSTEDQEKLKALENFKMHMVMNSETKNMNFDLSTDFKNADELQDMFKAMNSVSNLQGQGGVQESDSSNPLSTMGNSKSSELNYSYKGGVFKRTAKIIDEELHQQAMDSLSEMAMMFGASKYKLNYHFPRPIKSVSNDQAMFSEDRKSFALEFDFIEALKKPELLNVEVVLED